MVVIVLFSSVIISGGVVLMLGLEVVFLCIMWHEWTMSMAVDVHLLPGAAVSLGVIDSRRVII